jgi:hypothetical protein
MPWDPDIAPLLIVWGVIAFVGAAIMFKFGKRQ